MSKTHARLTARDEKIIRHVVRHRITVLEAVARLFFQGSGENAATKVLSRLVAEGHLQKFSLCHPNRKYWTQTLRTVRAHGGHRKHAAPLSAHSLARAYGALAFCCLGEVRRKRFAPREFMEVFPELHVDGLTGNYYFADRKDDRRRLGLIVVDTGPDYGRLISRCRIQVQKRIAATPDFRDLIMRGDFVVALITPYVEKKKRIDAAVRERDLPAPIEVEVCPLLGKLLGQRHAKG